MRIDCSQIINWVSIICPFSTKWTKACRCGLSVIKHLRLLSNWDIATFMPWSLLSHELSLTLRWSPVCSTDKWFFFSGHQSGRCQCLCYCRSFKTASAPLRIYVATLAWLPLMLWLRVHWISPALDQLSAFFPWLAKRRPIARQLHYCHTYTKSREKLSQNLVSSRCALWRPVSTSWGRWRRASW